MNSQPAISTRNLFREYRTREKGRERVIPALHGITLDIDPGELFGLLGPNGAGKTTLIKILTTLLLPTRGEARVLGWDVVTQAHRIRPHINMVSGGETSGYGLLTVEEQLWMFAQFYGIPTSEALKRIRTWARRLQLEDRLHTLVSELSTGLRQRVNLIRGFLTEPKVLFLDEPTVGLDVDSAHIVREVIREWMQTHPDRTVLLTTHLMHEAESLCHRVAIIHQGRIIACDTPHRLKQRLPREVKFQLIVHLPDGAPPDINEPGVIHARWEPRGLQWHLDLRLKSEDVLGSIITYLHQQGIRLISLQKHEPSLEDVYLYLVHKHHGTHTVF